MGLILMIGVVGPLWKIASKVVILSQCLCVCQETNKIPSVKDNVGFYSQKKTFHNFFFSSIKLPNLLKTVQ